MRIFMRPCPSTRRAASGEVFGERSRAHRRRSAAPIAGAPRLWAPIGRDGPRIASRRLVSHRSKAAVSILALCAAGAARAYTIETHFTESCHERITAEALRTARQTLEMARTPPSTADEQALIDDLQFVPDTDLKDLAGATLLI